MDGGKYFTRYRGKMVCIDSGLQICLLRYRGLPGTPEVVKKIDEALAHFLKDYVELYMKLQSGEFIPIVRLTSWFNAKEQAICLSPHYSIDPNIYNKVVTWQMPTKSS